MRRIAYLFGPFVRYEHFLHECSRRANYIRREIVAADYGISIADIAARWGIWHPSRLSQAYANHFGELPSDTKNRSGFN
jgi:AraC family ethanolamine operon transcriptional activator